ncbi:MAG: transglutaminase domain-containing protein [Actinobacteria bacterium]|nr:transglutaminase domain-containing protein [Actinomycetota bacterium]
MGRTLAAAAFPAFAVAVSWLRLEDPRVAGAVSVVTLLALLPALPPSGRTRALAAGVSALGALWLAFGTQPWELVPFRDERVVGPLRESIELGVGDFYGVVLPFDAARHPDMDGVLLLAVFGFVLAIALFVAARRPLAAAAVAVAGTGWPATLLGEGAVPTGALALAAALSIPLFLRARSLTALAAGAALAAFVVSGAAWASSATTFSRDGIFSWETWNFGRTPASALGVRFVWDASYDGISFPARETTVLRIAGVERAQYWRASTLDTFFDDRWFEELSGVSLREAKGPLALDALAPARARRQETWVEQRVQVKALVDDRLVAAGTPVAVDAPSVGSVFSYSGGVLRATTPLDVGTRYRIWSHLPDPSPAALASTLARYPSAAQRFLVLWGRSIPAYGRTGRDEIVRGLLENPSYSDFGAYRPLFERARRVTAGARSPYAAVLKIESWFRTSGGFRYEERPPRAIDLPPLVHFATVTKAGYCQHYAGAMALMLRMLGIPARVAVGFTSGQYADGAWNVTDRNAHAWVEVWFPRHGWVAFDPTPGRGTFSATYSFASDSAEAVDALGRGRLETLSGTGRDGRETDGFKVASLPSPRDQPSILLLAFVLALVSAAVIGTVKWLVRRLRYLTIQPRLIAAASRKELEAFLRDQGIAVPASATLDDLRRSFTEELGIDSRAFIEAAGRGRFGPPRDARRAAQSARAELRTLLRRARGGLSFRARVRGFFSLRSLRGWQG